MRTLPDAKQYWWIKGELEQWVYIPQPRDRFVYHVAWWCDYCGDVWARLLYYNLHNPLPGSGRRWRTEDRRCLLHGQGRILDAAVISHIGSDPIPIFIYEREFKRELDLYEISS